MSVHATHAGPRPVPSNLLDTVHLDHGPIEVLGRFLLQAEEAAAARGVSLSFATFDDLLATNARNHGSWKPLVGVFDPRYGTLTPATAFCIQGRDATGEVVATQAARIYQWPTSSFQEEAVSLRFVYPDPEAQKRPGERIEVTAQATRKVRGRVAFSGGAWYRPDYRKLDLGTILPRISRACALTLWDCEYVVSLQAEAVFNGGFAARAGFTKSDRQVRWVNSALGDIDFVFVWMDADELIGDLTDFSGSLARERETQIRRAGA
jgi:energy-converting hydrogenase Eha subunit E